MKYINITIKSDIIKKCEKRSKMKKILTTIKELEIKKLNEFLV